MAFALTRLQYLKPVATVNLSTYTMTGLGSASIAWFISTAINKSRSEQPSPTKPTLSQDMESYVWW
ncbi:hypothetical protein K7432_007255 [Basidiobolus ranarum]|uniref:Uncharacterized protein n=1 Tax=Basidiobolus ranarum TaxID=34480 RepID=A0ABR2W1A7_9FUNG